MRSLKNGLPIYHVKRSYELARNEGLAHLSRAARSFFYRNVLKTVCRDEDLFRLFTLKHHLRNHLLFDAVAAPYESIPVRVDDVELRHPEFNVNDCLGEVAGGDWDRERNLEPIRQEWIVAGLTERFREGTPWRDTRYVERPQNKYFSEGESRWGCDNVDEFIDKRCSYVERLYEDIERNGYKPASGGADNDTYDGKPQFRQRLEPLVLIGRDGEVIWGDGFHRYTMAKLLDIDEIPVQVAVRHRQWQELRDEIHRNGFAADHGPRIRRHPDLRDLLD